MPFAAVSIAATCGLASYYAAQNGLIDPGPLVFLTRSNKVAWALALLSGTPALTGSCLVLLLAAVSALAWALFRRSWLFTFAAISLTSLVVSTIIKNTFFPSIASELTLKPFMIRVNQISSNQPLVFYRDADYGAMFYARRHIPAYAAEAGKLKAPFLSPDVGGRFGRVRSATRSQKARCQ
jgi:hypothetical protein